MCWKQAKVYNLWIWESVSLGFGILHRPAQMQQLYRTTLDLTIEEAEAYVFGEFPGADVPLGMTTHLTKPGDLVVAFTAGTLLDHKSHPHALKVAGSTCNGTCGFSGGATRAVQND